MNNQKHNNYIVFNFKYKQNEMLIFSGIRKNKKRELPKNLARTVNKLKSIEKRKTGIEMIRAIESKELKNSKNSIDNLLMNL